MAHMFGFVLAFSAAMTHSSIDLFRKIASKRIPTVQLVCLVAVLEGTCAFAFVSGQVRSSRKPRCPLPAATCPELS